MPKIKEEEFYTANEIVKMGIMKASSDNTRKQMLLRFIRDGRIVAKNVGGEKSPRYIVKGKTLIEYMNTQVKPKQYTKK